MIKLFVYCFWEGQVLVEQIFYTIGRGTRIIIYYKLTNFHIKGFCPVTEKWDN